MTNDAVPEYVQQNIHNPSILFRSRNTTHTMHKMNILRTMASGTLSCSTQRAAPRLLFLSPEKTHTVTMHISCLAHCAAPRLLPSHPGV